jgi:hypothetical protein
VHPVAYSNVLRRAQLFRKVADDAIDGCAVPNEIVLAVAPTPK